MRKTLFITLAMALAPFGAFAVDGVVLINQSTVMAAGGFPYKITQPGSYKLSGNLSATAGTTAIQITTSNVTLDLNGFNVASLGPITFVPISLPIGIFITGTVSNIAIRNGSMVGWGPAILLYSGSLMVVEDVSIEANFTIGNGMISNALAVITTSGRSLLKRVLTDGQLQVSCPSVISESQASSIFRSGSGCVLSDNAIDVIL